MDFDAPNASKQVVSSRISAGFFLPSNQAVAIFKQHAFPGDSQTDRQTERQATPPGSN